MHWEPKGHCAIVWGERGANGAKQEMEGWRGSERSGHVGLMGPGFCSNSVRVLVG